MGLQKSIWAVRPLVVLGAAAVAAACFAGQSFADEAGAAFSPRPQGGIPGALLPSERKLWTYDSATGKYVEAPGDASGQYTPNLRKPSKPLTFAFAEGWAAIPFSVSINKGIYKIAGDLGINIIYCDQEFKPEKAVTCAEQLSQQKPDFAIVSNWQSGAAEAIMKIYDAAKIPVVNIDVWHPNGIFFGADNYVSGEIGGKAAGEYAKSLGKCGDAILFNGVNPGEGDAADQRMAGFNDGVQEVCGAIPDGSHLLGDLRRRHHRAGADQDDRLADRPPGGDFRPRHLDRRRALRRHFQGARPERARRRRSRPRLRRDRRRRDQGRRSGGPPSSSAASPTSRRSIPTT